ncbi:MAG: methyltransferase domain-containing protein [Flavobacteriaceae bacterium]|nr:methyltransferase domain-containing protein [Flavobacteriaceae bacterium]
MTKKTEWFQDWFDTSYYHTLYNHRNDDEARFFMKNLITFLNLKKGNKILDLPCGKGRHALFLNEQGFDVVGADLSRNSILTAKKHENNTLHFFTHDMRNAIEGKYDAIFNLFTSFGYFNDELTNVIVLKNFKKAVNQNGHIIIDFLNIKKIEKELIPKEEITKNGISFLIKKSITNQFLIKDIYFNADDKNHHFTEKVQCLDLDKFKDFVLRANLKVQNVFGDYSLNPFDENKSDRLILILQ